MTRRHAIAAEIAVADDVGATAVVFALALVIGAGAAAAVAGIDRKFVGAAATPQSKWRWVALIGPLSVPAWGHALGASGGAAVIGALGAFLAVMFGFSGRARSYRQSEAGTTN